MRRCKPIGTPKSKRKKSVHLKKPVKIDVGRKKSLKSHAILVVPLSNKIVNLAEARNKFVKDQPSLIKSTPKNPHITLWYTDLPGESVVSIASIQKSFEFMVQKYQTEGKMDPSSWYIRGGGDLKLFGSKIAVPAEFPGILQTLVVDAANHYRPGTATHSILEIEHHITIINLTRSTHLHGLYCKNFSVSPIKRLELWYWTNKTMHKEKIYLFPPAPKKIPKSIGPPKKITKAPTTDSDLIAKYQIMRPICSFCKITLPFDPNSIEGHLHGKKHLRSLPKSGAATSSDNLTYYGCQRALIPGCPVCNLPLKISKILAHQQTSIHRRHSHQLESFKLRRNDSNLLSFIFLSATCSSYRIGCGQCLQLLDIEETYDAHEVTPMHQLLSRVPLDRSTLTSSSSRSSMDPHRYFQSLSDFATNESGL